MPHPRVVDYGELEQLPPKQVAEVALDRGDGEPVLSRIVGETAPLLHERDGLLGGHRRLKRLEQHLLDVRNLSEVKVDVA